MHGKMNAQNMPSLRALLAVAAGCSVIDAVGLQDDPIVGDVSSAQYLDGVGWQVTNGTLGPFDARVPGDLLTDLQTANVIGDPLYELNFVPQYMTALPIWDASNWTYSTTFDLDPAIVTAADAWIVFDGVKMAADITLNGHYLGYTNDQFLRYNWPVKSYLQPTGNVLSVTFPTSVDPRNDEARFMACR